MLVIWSVITVASTMPASGPQDAGEQHAADRSWQAFIDNYLISQHMDLDGDIIFGLFGLPGGGVWSKPDDFPGSQSDVTKLINNFNKEGVFKGNQKMFGRPNYFLIKSNEDEMYFTSGDADGMHTLIAYKTKLAVLISICTDARGVQKCSSVTADLAQDLVKLGY